MRIRKSKKNRQHNGQKIQKNRKQWTKDTKLVMRIRKSKKNRQHNGKRYQRGNENP